MAKKRGGHVGGHGWFVTFADLMGLLLSFFVMLVAFSSQDKQKLQIVAGSMRDAFGVQQVRYSGIVEPDGLDRKSTRLNSSHGYISYAVFCLKKKKLQTATAGRVSAIHYPAV